MSTQAASNGFSANVRIDLVVDGQRIPVAQAGGDRIVLRQPAKIDATVAELVIAIDGHERRWRVALRPSGRPDRVHFGRFDDPHVTTITDRQVEINPPLRPLHESKFK